MEEPEFPAVTVSAEEAGSATHVRWGQEVADEIVRRTEAGESLRSVCRDERMPSTRAVCQWLQEKPAFREAMLAARAYSCAPLRGRRPIWCADTAQAILDRVAGGEALVAVCRDPAMPSQTTVYNWRGRNPEFNAALEEAQDMRAERLAESAWELALRLGAERWGEGVEAGRAYACEVMLRQLRWHVGKLSPSRFGAKKAVEVDKPPAVKTVILKTLVIGADEEGEPSVFWIAPNPDTGEVERVNDGRWPGVEKAKGFVKGTGPRPGAAWVAPPPCAPGEDPGGGL